MVLDLNNFKFHLLDVLNCPFELFRILRFVQLGLQEADLSPKVFGFCLVDAASALRLNNVLLELLVFVREFLHQVLDAVVGAHAVLLQLLIFG